MVSIKLIALLLVAYTSAQEWEIPSFCKGLDCPVYELLEATEVYYFYLLNVTHSNFARAEVNVIHHLFRQFSVVFISRM